MDNRLRIFDPHGWELCCDIEVEESLGISRPGETVTACISLPAGMTDKKTAQFRLINQFEDVFYEIPSQFFDLETVDGSCSITLCFSADVSASESRTYQIFVGPAETPPPTYETDLMLSPGTEDDQHFFIENEYYRIETLPKSGQIWHVWNKIGANVSWHHLEWKNNSKSGGDPCHWAPNCWVAHPDRVTHGYEVPYGGRDPDQFDWHYVFGWRDPETEIELGSEFIRVRRRGIVWPHPEHASADLIRDGKPLIFAEVEYRYFRGSPFIFQSSRIETLEDIDTFFIRNCQFVFLTGLFTHMIIAPDDDGLLPGDESEAAVLRLMAEQNVKPQDWAEHTLSNVLPSKLAYYGYYHQESGDGFALFQLSEKNTNIHTGVPTFYNHTTHLTEVHGWSTFASRAFSYTNQRFNPENVQRIPAGERYEEENMIMMYKHNSLEETMKELALQNRRVKSPLVCTVRKSG